MLCSKCGKTILDGAMFCPYCGKKIEKEITCPQCGTKLLPDALFCHTCGTGIPVLQTCETSNIGSLNAFAEPLNADSEPEKAALPKLSE